MTLPGNIGTAVPDGPDWLVRTVRDLQREMAQLRTAIPANAVIPATVNLSKSWNAKTANGTGEAVSTDVVVPAGYTRVLGVMTGTLTGFHDNTTNLAQLGIQLGAYRQTGSYDPGASQDTIIAESTLSGGTFSVWSTLAFELDTIPSKVHLYAIGEGGYAFGSGPANNGWAYLSASLIFMR